MSRYPNLDPDQAVAGPVLEAIREVLHSWIPASLPSETMAAMLHEVLSPADQHDAATFAEEGPVLADEHQPAFHDQEAGHYAQHEAHAQELSHDHLTWPDGHVEDHLHADFPDDPGQSHFGADPEGGHYT